MQYSTNSATDLNNVLYALEKGGIERQEVHEQAKLINSCDLPKKCDDWAKLESWGVVKGISTDPLFVSVTLPEEWRKIATDHSMWSHLVDINGLIRAAIFYKGAFYDRSAHMHVTSVRYCISPNYDNKDSIAYEVCDAASGKTVQQFPDNHWGYITFEDKKIVGLIHSGRFYYNVKGRYEDARFLDSCDASLAHQITLDQFYKEFHHIKSYYDEIGAAKFLAKQDAVTLATIMNQQSGW